MTDINERRVVRDDDPMREFMRESGWPPALVKAVRDNFSFALMLRDSSLIYFTHAERVPGSHEWVHLDDPECSNGPVSLPFGRGLDVRVADIMWVADGPGEIR